MRTLELIESWVETFNLGLLFVMKWIAITLIAVMTTIVLAGVFFRYVLGDALAWSEEISKFLMVWMTFTAAPIAYREGALVAVGIVADRFKGRIHSLLSIFIQLIVIAIMFVFLKEGTFLTYNARIQFASTLDWFSIVWVYIAMPIGALGLLTVAIGLLLRSICELIRPSPPLAPPPKGPSSPDEPPMGPPINIPGAM